MSIIDILSSVPGTMISGTLLGFANRMIDQRHERLLSTIKADDNDLNKARMVKSVLMQWMQFLVVMISCLAFFSKPFVAAAMHWPMWVAYDESHGWIVSIFKGHGSVVMRAFEGLVNSPTDNQVMIFIMTFLFGRMRISRMR